MEEALSDLAIRLVRIEHAMRLGEHPELRNWLEQATQNEEAAWAALNKVHDGDRSAFGQLLRTTREADAASQHALALVHELHGDQAFTGQGERIGCFFCARPLAHADYRHRLILAQGINRTEVITCPVCAALARHGKPLTIRTEANGRTHWSEMPGYDPYAQRHGPQTMQQIDAICYEPQQAISHLSACAAGRNPAQVATQAGTESVILAFSFPAGKGGATSSQTMAP